MVFFEFSHVKFLVCMIFFEEKAIFETKSALKLSFWLIDGWLCGPKMHFLWNFLNCNEVCSKFYVTNMNFFEIFT